MPVYLHGLALQFYRGIGPDIQKLAPFKEFNFFIGSNNSGKSIILNFIYKFVPRNTKLSIVEPLDQYRGSVTGKPLMAFGVPLQGFIEAVIRNAPQGQIRQPLIAPLKHLCTRLSENSVIWIKSQIPKDGKFQYLIDTKSIRTELDDHIWQNVWTSLTNQRGGGIDDWVLETLAFLLRAQVTAYPEASLIPAIRQVGPKEEAFEDFSGRGLIDRLAEIQSPDHDKRHERDLFDRINSFLQTVTGREDAKIEIPHNREHILVHMDNKVLPLHYLGTGIHEVIMIAAFCTLSIEKIVCIEEPEIHLHPLLQRKLVKYLKHNTSNQYFIATHSASFIDTPEAAIFHVVNDGVSTSVRESILRHERFSICLDLGVRASDIVQANCVIWVEGPSDRIYVRHWIAAVAPELTEGIHYSIMFYGGRLLNHLSADDEEVNEFISLRSLNRHLAIVMDSDKRHNRDVINETKGRIVAEFQKGSGVAWITRGREIENYVTHQILQQAVQQIYAQQYMSPCSGGIYDHAYYFRRRKIRRRKGHENDDGIERNVDKIKIAKIVCSGQAVLTALDLNDRINEIVQLIRRANE